MLSLFWFIVLVGGLIFAHEGGHFLFAKLFRVKVLTFSLGFGGPIRLGRFKLSIKPHETEYRLAWCPLGGFVRMLGDDPSQSLPPEDQPRAFLSQAAWKRFLIILGGPLFSVLLAIPIYFVFHVVQSHARDVTVGSVVASMPAGEGGVRPGDKVLRVDAQEVETWDEIDDRIQAAGGKPIDLEVQRKGERLRFSLKPAKEFDERGLDLLGDRWDLGLRHERLGNMIGIVSPDSPAGQSGLLSWDGVVQVGGIPVSGWEELAQVLHGNGRHVLPISATRVVEVKIGAVVLWTLVVFETVLRPLPAEAAPESAWRTPDAYFGIEPIDLYVHNVSKEGPAEKAGIVPGDKLVSVLGRAISSWEDFSQLIYDSGGGNVAIQIRHQGVLKDITFTPALIEQTDEFKQTTKKLGLGVEYQRNVVGGGRVPRPDRLQHALKMSVVETGQAITMNVLGFVRIFQGRVAASDAIGGPLMFMKVAGKTAERGWDSFLTMMAFVSVLLGLLNLLPIPILDGGHLALILIEVIRRRPLSIQARMVASWFGLVLLVALMAFAIGNDIHRYWSDITSIFG